MKRKTFILSGFIIAKFILQYLLISPGYDLQRDEYLHLDQANHLARGYISVPPVTSWIAYIIKLLGNSFFWIKFFPALFGALTIVIVWKMVEELKGNLFALILGSSAVLVSVILRINILFQPNSFDIFFWTLLYYTIIKYISTANSNWLLAAALAAGLGILSKYNIIFLLAGLLPAVLLTEHRKIFLNKKFYMGIGIVLVIILPNMLWQYQNNYPTIHQLHELARTQLVNVKRMDFVKEQFIFFMSSLVIILAAFIAFLFYKVVNSSKQVIYFTGYSCGLQFLLPITYLCWFLLPAIKIFLFPVLLNMGYRFYPLKKWS